MYTGKLILTNPRMVPFALSNHFDDTFGLSDGLKEVNTAEEFCALANDFHRYGRTWKIDKDSETETRLLNVDTLGNKHYLIAEKLQPAPSTYIYEVVGINSFKGFVFAHCTTHQGAMTAKRILREKCNITDVEIAPREMDVLYINTVGEKLNISEEKIQL